MDKKETKWEDPIIAGNHATRKALVEQCGNDPQAVFEYYLQKQKEGQAQGWQYDHDIFKIFLLDVGLLAAMSDISAKTLIEGNRFFTEFKGAFIENFVAQELACNQVEKLYYWTSNGTAEVDFLVEIKGEIVPLEVKAGVDKKKKSLRVYANKHQPKAICRSTLLNLKQDGDVRNYPLYALKLFLRMEE